MKKITALLLVLVLALSFSVSAFAFVSPGGTEYDIVVVNRTESGTSSETPETYTVTVEDDNTVTLAPIPNDDKDFEGWQIYSDWDKSKKKGTPAVEGKDYELINIQVVEFDEGGNATSKRKAVKGVDYDYDGDGNIISIEGAYLEVSVKLLKDVEILYVSEVYDGVEVNFNYDADVQKKADKVGDIATPLAVLVAGIGVALVAVSKKRV